MQFTLDETKWKGFENDYIIMRIFNKLKYCSKEIAFLSYLTGLKIAILQAWSETKKSRVKL